MKHKHVRDVFDAVRQAESRQDKVDILLTNDSPVLQELLRLNYGVVVFDVDLDMKYQPRQPHDFVETIGRSMRLWSAYYTTFTHHDRHRKNLRFRYLLEGLEPRDAELLIAAGKGELNLGLTQANIEDCFPTIFKE